MTIELLRERKERQQQRQKQTPRTPRPGPISTDRSERSALTPKPKITYTEPLSPMWMTSNVGPMSPSASARKYENRYNAVDLPVPGEEPLITLIRHWDAVNNQVTDHTPVLNRNPYVRGSPFAQRSVADGRDTPRTSSSRSTTPRTPMTPILIPH